MITWLPLAVPWMLVVVLAAIPTGIPTLGIAAAVAWRSRRSGPRGGARLATLLGHGGRRGWPDSYRRRARAARRRAARWRQA